jgi:molybdate transport system substrate-binding protein
MPERRATLALAAAAAVVAFLPLLGVAGCASAVPGTTPASSDDSDDQVVVFAAASLAQVFELLADEFEADNPGADIVISYGGSSALAEQIIGGAPAAIFAAASTATMQSVVDAGLAWGEPVVFARNALEIAVPPGNPAGVTGLADLADPGLTIALCSPEVPCGAASAEAFESAGITPAPDTLELDVTAVVTRVRLGDVDAGLVYRTDVIAAAPEVEGIELSDAEQVLTDDVIVALESAGATATAQAFLSFLLSDHAREVLLDAGFQAP